MTIPANPSNELAPYGPAPVIPVGGPQGGPYTVISQSEIGMLSSASRTATTSSGAFLPAGCRGAYLFWDVTVNPGGAQTLALAVEMLDPITAVWIPIATVAASATPGGVILLYPGCGTAPIGNLLAVFGIPLGNKIRVTVTHSAAGAWTYSVYVGWIP